MANRARLYIYWIPPILWAAAIFGFSSQILSSENTGPIVESFITAIFGYTIKPSTINTIHYLMRKAGHLTEYAILAALLFRAIRRDRTGWNWRWAAAAIAIAALYAATDEFHQSFVPGRTPSVWDVLLDTTGASLAQVLFFRR
jgi:VanZ family protein